MSQTKFQMMTLDQFALSLSNVSVVFLFFSLRDLYSDIGLYKGKLRNSTSVIRGEQCVRATRPTKSPEIASPTI